MRACYSGTSGQHQAKLSGLTTTCKTVKVSLVILSSKVLLVTVAGFLIFIFADNILICRALADMVSVFRIHF